MPANTSAKITAPTSIRKFLEYGGSKRTNAIAPVIAVARMVIPRSIF